MHRARVVRPALRTEDDTLFEPRLVMLDWRFSKIFRIGGVRVQGLVDFFNLMNVERGRWRVSDDLRRKLAASDVSTVPGRTARLGAKVDW